MLTDLLLFSLLFFSSVYYICYAVLVVDIVILCLAPEPRLTVWNIPTMTMIQYVIIIINEHDEEPRYNQLINIILCLLFWVDCDVVLSLLLYQMSILERVPAGAKVSDTELMKDYQLLR